MSDGRLGDRDLSGMSVIPVWWQTKTPPSVCLAQFHFQKQTSQEKQKRQLFWSEEEEEEEEGKWRSSLTQRSKFKHEVRFLLALSQV